MHVKFSCHMALQAALLTVLLAAATTAVLGNDFSALPPNKAQLNAWFNQNVRPVNERRSTLDPWLVAAEQGRRVITVRKDGSGNFRRITDAINSVPSGNTRRVIIYIGPGVYQEKITIDRTRRFITLYGNPNAMPTLVFGGTAAQYGTVDSGTLMALADYFVAANLIIRNSAPRPDGRRKGAQASALRISGNKSSFYNCRILGFQDTVCDDRGYHLFKDCYIEGTVDFIFGSGTSLYLNSELHVIPDNGLGYIAAQARETNDNTGFSFVHCVVTGTGGNGYLGRAWMSRSRVVYIYTRMSNAVNPAGWSDNFHPERRGTVFYGEYGNFGSGANQARRVKYTKKLTFDQAKPYMTLGFIKGSSWLLPPPRL